VIHTPSFDSASWRYIPPFPRFFFGTTSEESPGDRRQNRAGDDSRYSFGHAPFASDFLIDVPTFSFFFFPISLVLFLVEQPPVVATGVYFFSSFQPPRSLSRAPVTVCFPFFPPLVFPFSPLHALFQEKAVLKNRFFHGPLYQMSLFFSFSKTLFSLAEVDSQPCWCSSRPDNTTRADVERVAAVFFIFFPILLFFNVWAREIPQLKVDEYMTHVSDTGYPFPFVGPCVFFFCFFFSLSRLSVFSPRPPRFFPGQVLVCQSAVIPCLQQVPQVVFSSSDEPTPRARSTPVGVFRDTNFFPPRLTVLAGRPPPLSLSFLYPVVFFFLFFLFSFFLPPLPHGPAGHHRRPSLSTPRRRPRAQGVGGAPVRTPSRRRGSLAPADDIPPTLFTFSSPFFRSVKTLHTFRWVRKNTDITRATSFYPPILPWTRRRSGRSTRPPFSLLPDFLF